MRNCLIAQSGGPTSVINSSVVGVILENNIKKYYDNIFGGVNGIEGILEGNIINLSEISEDDLELYKKTPSSGLGSCRYKMKNSGDSEEEYLQFFKVLDDNNIDTFFYIGGNDSMDTVAKLSSYAASHGIKKQIIGIPKTIDNDLVITDHTPGFGSAAKFISTVALETYLDSSVYTNNGIFILETMGRDTGWLAASAALARIDGRSVADFIFLPERAFCKEDFLKDVRAKFKEQNQVFIVVSEGIKDENGDFVSEVKKSGLHDKFGHSQLGGACGYLKELILHAGITTRVKTLELGVLQRCAMHSVSEKDLEEAVNAGRAAYNFAMEGVTGYMIGIKRTSNSPYLSESFIIKAADVCNKVKYVPENWINKEGNHVSEEVIKYIEPLIMGEPQLSYQSGVPKFITLK